jgi:hypothetical protein
MKLNDITLKLGLTNLTPEIQLDESLDVSAGHASDLLSDVLANAPTDSVLITIQVHMNVIAVALHAGVAAVIFAAGLEPDEAVKERAALEKLPLFSSDESTFDIAGKLYALGLRGRRI